MYRRHDSYIGDMTHVLIKLSTMLQIAFGEAGSDIITTNLNSGSDVNALIPGTYLSCLMTYLCLMFDDVSTLIRREA
jgi:hypothetical protein